MLHIYSVHCTVLSCLLIPYIKVYRKGVNLEVMVQALKWWAPKIRPELNRNVLYGGTNLTTQKSQILNSFLWELRWAYLKGLIQVFWFSGQKTGQNGQNRRFLPKILIFGPKSSFLAQKWLDDLNPFWSSEMHQIWSIGMILLKKLACKAKFDIFGLFI